MKVYQSSSANGDNSTNAGQMLLNQLREITGIQNSEVLHRALSASQGDIGHAVGLLTTPITEVQDPGEPQDVIPNGEGVPKDELQAAIELSLRESKKALEEEREFNRALEASAEETTSRVKRKRSEVQNEICSPADWIRMDDWPVGIRNVGNTCWFSAVIQSLFHLPVFRRLVLGYSLTEQLLEKCKSHSDKRNIAFMQELRCLFALMVASTRRFVDPSAAVELLRDAFRTNEAQQDVSEFSHKLLDWLEDAFQLAANGKNPEDKQENPMVQLFYGTFVTERRHEGKTLSNIEQFGQYPLQVNGYSNLDECLEGAMVEKDIESLHSDQISSPSHERWFSKLPPVLTFELSRFEFNAQLGRPEKIHKKLEFPQIVYMDRYLHKNIEQTHGRRGDVKRLKEQLAMLQQKLECYKNYGSGPTKYPLADMLQYVLEFATTKPTSASPAVDLQASSPTPPSQLPTDPLSEDTSYSQPGDTAGAEGLVSSCQRTPIYKPFTQCRPPKDYSPHPAPHSISEEELHSVKSCLQRWRTEAENNINELKASIDRVSQTLEGMYTDNSLCQVPYRLHAVLVHEGQASAGHYWAYIYDHANQRWMKYNDISISESSWEELMRESYGGMTNASAYCLMYIDDSLPNLIAEDTDDETGQVLHGLDSLPPVLKRYVHEDNRWFQQEISEWEEQFCQQQASHQGEPAPAPTPVVPPAEALRARMTRQTRAESTEPPLSEAELPAAEEDQTPTPPETEEPNERLESPEPCGDDAEERFHTPDSFTSQTQEEEDVPCGESNESSGAVAATATPLGPGQEDSTSAATTPVPEEEEQQGEHQPSSPTAKPGSHTAKPGSHTAEPGSHTAEPGSHTAEPGSNTAEPGSHTAEPAGSQTSSADVEVEESEREVGVLDVVTEEPYEDPDVSGTQAEVSGGGEPREAVVEQDGEGEEEEEEEGATVRRRRRRLPAENEVSEVDIPNVGRIMVRADADGYNEEMMLTPAMQGVILAIAKARQTFDTEGPEAGLIKAFHEEYCRLYELSQEEVTLQEDPRLQHSLVYFFQNKAPNKVVERTLLEQFTDRNLSFDDRAISIMREARSKLRLIKPEDMDMDEYLDWHDDYRLFRTVFVYLLTGLEQYQHGKVREALTYLAHAHKNNAMLLRKGEKKGVEQSVIALYRRKCLMALNESAAQLFCGGEESEVEEGMAIMNDAIIPCLHLMGRDDSSLTQEDLDVMENIRSHWCSCLGQDMNESLQEKLGEFLPRVLDGSAEMVILKDPPKVHVSFPHDICSRLTAVMESIHNTSIVIVK